MRSPLPIVNSIERLARSYGFLVPRTRGSVQSLPCKGKQNVWRLPTLTRVSDGSPGPVVVVRLVGGKMKWEPQT